MSSSCDVTVRSSYLALWLLETSSLGAGDGVGSKNRGFINSVADDYGKHTMFLNKEYLLDGRSSLVLVICVVKQL